ncbi:MAG: hypothetical protein JO165_01950 [Candidatus Eremiobacteraeota bacterium]|nr:hypothetical protein [Candidatus Eremiobacteraeota bacterium]
MASVLERWPVLKYDEWKDTLATVHMWTQIVGKIRLRQEYLINHWWNVTLYVTNRGLTTAAMRYENGRTFTIDFDFVDHLLQVRDCDGRSIEFRLQPMTVADFYHRLMNALDDLGIHVNISKKPNEVADPIAFDQDTVHKSYDREYMEHFWRALVQADRLCKEFRASFIGKASPVHFFWGSFDLAVTRFSGRTAPPHPGGFPNMPDSATREAYSHELQSVGFWPGGFGLEAQFYAYAYPTPEGFEKATVRPKTAAWSDQLREFLLPYDAVRTSATPDQDVLDFFDSTYEAAANSLRWDRAALERHSS